jgi:hypothetical protein
MTVRDYVFRLLGNADQLAKSTDLAAKSVDRLTDGTGRLVQQQAAAERRAVSLTATVAQKADALLRVATIAGGAAVTGLAAMTKAAIDNADAAGKAAQSAGITVESYTALRYAAELAGVEQANLGIALTQLNKAINGNAPALAELGVKTTDASGALRQADEVLLELSDRFAALPDGPRKAALAVELFGRSGAQLVPLLNSGRESIEQLRAEAVRLGVTISTDTSRAAETFNDNLARLGTAGTAAGLAIANKLLPGLADASDYFIRATKEAGLFQGALISIGAALARAGGFDEIGKLSSQAKAQAGEIERLTNVLTGLDNVLEREPGNEAARRRFENLRAQLVALQRDAAATTDRLKQLASETVQTAAPPAPKVQTTATKTPATGNLARTVASRSSNFGRSEFVGPEVPQALTAALQRIASTDVAKIAELREELQSLISIRDSGAGGAAVDEAIGRVQKAIEDLQPQQEEASGLQRELNALLEQTPTAQLERARQQVEQLSAALAQTTDPAQAQKIREAIDAITRPTSGLPQVTDEMRRANDFAQQFGTSFSSALEDAIVDFRDLRSVAAGFGQDLLRISVRSLVTEPLGQAVADLVKGKLSLSELVSSASGPVQAISEVIKSSGAAQEALGSAASASAAAAQAAAMASLTAAATASTAAITAETTGRAALSAAVASEAAASTALTASLAGLAAAGSAAAVALQTVAASGAASGGAGLLGGFGDVLSLFGLNIPFLDTGTNRVPKDMLAVVHKDEAVIPARFNPAAFGSLAGNQRGPAAGPPKVEINVIGAPAPKETKVQQRSDGTMQIDLLYDEFERRLAGDVSNGHGLLDRAIKGRYGASGAAGLRR